MKIVSIARTGGYCGDCIFYTTKGNRICSPVRGYNDKSWYHCYPPSLFKNIRDDIVCTRDTIIFL